MDFEKERRITLLIFIFSFSVTTLLSAGFALWQPLRSNIFMSYLCAALLLFGTVALRRMKKHRGKILGVFLLIAVLNLILVPGEILLRMRNFHYESGIQFGYPRPSQFNAFDPDTSLFWKFPPSRGGINSYGFRCKGVEIPKPAGSFRILFLGNSCTYQGHPGIIETLLRDSLPGIECLNFATPGYTTYQGKVIVRKWMDELDPDLLITSFGWNDRWLAYGTTDEAKRIEISGSAAARITRTVYSKWRLLQATRKLLSPLMGSSKPLEVPRVPPGKFRENLKYIGKAASRRGIPVIFATEPSSHASRGLPDFMINSRFVKSRESHLELLREYNEIIRDVSSKTAGWYLVDLDALISGREDVDDLIKQDGIHFTDKGISLVAALEAERILELYRPEGETE